MSITGDIMRAALKADGGGYLPGDTDAQLLERLRCSWRLWPGATIEVMPAVSGTSCFCRMYGKVVSQGKAADAADAEMWALKRALETQRERTPS